MPRNNRGSPSLSPSLSLSPTTTTPSSPTYHHSPVPSSCFRQQVKATSLPRGAPQKPTRRSPEFDALETNPRDFDEFTPSLLHPRNQKKKTLNRDSVLLYEFCSSYKKIEGCDIFLVEAPGAHGRHWLLTSLSYVEHVVGRGWEIHMQV